MERNIFKEIGGMYRDEGFQIRRDIHANPELSFEEFKTSDLIEDELAEVGISAKRVGLTGLVADIGTGDEMVALRADIDALPINENTGLPYSSKNPGVMHACGHDMHTTMLLMAAKYLKSIESEIGGRVRLIFQHAEEVLPGGAVEMINAGVLDGVKAIFGQHIYPDRKVGEICIKSGPMLAACDEVHIKLNGVSGHAAQPQNAANPIIAGAAVVQALSSLMTTSRNPIDPGVLTLCTFKDSGGNTTNVIPQGVEIKGTFRSFDTVWQKQIHEKIEHIVEGIAQGFGVSADVDIRVGYPFVNNDPALTSFFSNVVENSSSGAKLFTIPPLMWGEDFGSYGKVVPAVFFLNGVRDEVEIVTGLHTPTIDPSEKAMVYGSTVLVEAALGSFRRAA